MTHIANCIRESVMDRSHMHISDDIARMEPDRPDSRTSIRTGIERSQSTRRGQPRYQLWPSNKSPAAHSRAQFSQDKQAALSVQRSATAMGDAIVTDTYASRSRQGSLSRRRKVSVPELQPPAPMATLQEGLMDSPTIPGRPPAPIQHVQPVQPIQPIQPIQQKPLPSPGHERSGSAPPTHWRANPFGSAMISSVTGPAFVATHSKSSPTSQPDLDRSLPPLKPLSPILSPTNTKAAKPDLKLDTTNDDDDIPPQVPPKSPSLFKKKSSPAMRQQQIRNDSAMGISTIPEGSTNTGIMDCSSPETLQRRDTTRGHSRKRSDQSVMDRGRPIARARKERSRQGSSASSSEKDGGDTWKLPKGVSISEAPVKYAPAEREKLRGKAVEQAEKFEVLSSRDVAALAKEMRALDERCEYLRKTYKSLRAGRQKLHARMISYLKRSETIVFSRESILKQEEALVELDLSIDDWMAKIEQAENRRLRIRQKLLEHLAAAVAMAPETPVVDAAEATPPRSPIKAEGAESPHRVDRKDVESIRIYADGHVLNLFSDIEQAIGKMCEAAC